MLDVKSKDLGSSAYASVISVWQKREHSLVVKATDSRVQTVWSHILPVPLSGMPLSESLGLSKPEPLLRWK